MRWTAYLRGVLAFSFAGVLFLYLLSASKVSCRARSASTQWSRRGPSTPPRRSWPAPAGSRTTANRRWGTSCRPPVSPCRTSSRGGRHGRGRRPRAGLRPRSHQGAGQLLVGPGARGHPRAAATSVLGALVLVACGVIQNFSGIHEVGQFLGGPQQWNGGAVASQEVIKELGTNGGGYFQRQQRPSLREPDAVHQPVRDLPDPARPGLPDPDLRRHGRLGASGLRDPRVHGHHLGRLRRPHDVDRVRPPGPRAPGGRRRRWRARSCASGSVARRSSR